MSTGSSTQTQNRGTNARGGRRGGNRGRGGDRRGAARGVKGSQNNKVSSPLPKVDNTEVQQSKNKATIDDTADEAEDGQVCWICAEPVKYWSVPECNHRTCHVCALRLRALYKKMDCTFCKEPQPTVIFSSSPDALFSSYTPEDIPYKDVRLSIFFESEEMMEETLILLRFNCPDSTCDYTATGWSDLKLHIRAMHGKLLCDLCIRLKKVFSHEHALYTPSQLPLHLPSMPHRHQKPSQPKEQVEGGTHPLCAFCRECFFGDDELFSHMRERHEECFICKRNEVRDQYFQDYGSLEKHFNHAHHPCTQPQCLVQKFVVFNSALDLKAHMVEEHGGEMTSRDKRDARRIQADFEFEEVGIGGNRNGRGRRGDREREPPPQTQPPPVPPPQRPPGPGRRREGFGATLTVDDPPSNANGRGNQTIRRSTPSPPHRDVDPEVAERHAAFIARLQSIAPNVTSAVPAVRAAIRGFRSSESSARDLISTVWNIMDSNLEDTASLVNAVVDLLVDEDKKKDLLSSWNGFKIEQRRQFPDLVPTSVGGGYSGIASGRVLNAKHATARSSAQSSRQVWDRVAQAASSSAISAPVPRPADRFPPLQAPVRSIPGPTVGHSYRQSPRNTPWSSSAQSGFRPSSSVATPTLTSRPASRNMESSAGAGSGSGSGSSGLRPPAPALSSTSFPELPSPSEPRQKATVSGNVSLKKILGGSTPSAPAWQPAGSTTLVGGPGVTEADAASESTPTKGKKGKQKQKQTLFTLGAFPA